MWVRCAMLGLGFFMVGLATGYVAMGATSVTGLTMLYAFGLITIATFWGPEPAR